MRKIANIIFSDFIGTLASGDDGLSIEESCHIIQNFLSDYLVGDNNYFVIISSIDHFSPQLFTECLKHSTSNLTDSQKEKLVYYMTDTKNTTSLELNGFHLNFMGNNKSLAVESALSNYFYDYELGKVLAAGDTANDISMLLKIHDLGGESLLVKDQRYYDALSRKDITELINDIPYYYKDCSTELTQFKQQLSSELNSLYKSGKISHEQLIELTMLYTEIVDYIIYPCYDSQNTLSTDKVTEISKKLTLVKDRREIFNIFNSKMKDF